MSVTVKEMLEKYESQMWTTCLVSGLDQESIFEEINVLIEELYEKTDEDFYLDNIRPLPDHMPIIFEVTLATYEPEENWFVEFFESVSEYNAAACLQVDTSRVSSAVYATGYSALPFVRISWIKLDTIED